MEVHHHPHPVHGWREFAKEVGIIMVGVLLALGAEQSVEAIHWRHKVEVVRSSLMGELANDRGRWEANVAASRCALPLIDRLDQWARTGRGPPPAANVNQAELFWTHTANWGIATSSQALDHMPVADQLKFASLYAGLVHREVTIEQEDAAVAQVNTRLPLAYDDRGRRDLRIALSELKDKLRRMLEDDAYMARHFDALGVKADRKDFAADVTGCGAR